MAKKFQETGCSYCGVKPGEPCIVTLAEPDAAPLSIAWQHRAREQAAA